MSHVHNRRLARIQEEFSAVRGAVGFVGRAWATLHDIDELKDVARPGLRRAAQQVEATYIVRLFSEFEAMLQDDWVATHPWTRTPGTTEALINRVASGRRIRSEIREGAHAVREYRNSVVHHRAAPTPALEFDQTFSVLNRFVAVLPDRP